MKLQDQILDNILFKNDIADIFFDFLDLSIIACDKPGVFQRISNFCLKDWRYPKYEIILKKLTQFVTQNSKMQKDLSGGLNNLYLGQKSPGSLESQLDVVKIYGVIVPLKNIISRDKS